VPILPGVSIVPVQASAPAASTAVEYKRRLVARNADRTMRFYRAAKRCPTRLTHAHLRSATTVQLGEALPE
jgi:hypothetical protein